MALRQEARIASFDADEACQWLVEDLGRDLRTVAEFGPGEYRLLYVADHVAEEYGSIDAVQDVAEPIHEYIELDFRERDLFVDLFPPMESVQGFVTVAEGATVARVLAGDEGLFFSVEPGAPAVPSLSELVERFLSE